MVERNTVHDADNAVLTDAELTAMRPMAEVLPDLAAFGLKNRGGRPKAKITKKQVTIRLSRGVVDGFRAMGAGWQTKMDRALQEWLETH